MFHPTNKFIKIDYLKDRQKKGDKIVFVNGCFDIIHCGHIDFLKKASYLGKYLIVGLNSDDSIRQIKGNNRPINCEEHRSIVLNSISYISTVILFDEKTPLKLIKELSPDILVKGSDWNEEDIVGSEIVKNNGGVVKTIPFTYDVSTTKLINRINNIK